MIKMLSYNEVMLEQQNYDEMLSFQIHVFYPDTMVIEYHVE